jgi:hypothetical protein
MSYAYGVLLGLVVTLPRTTMCFTEKTYSGMVASFSTGHHANTSQVPVCFRQSPVM